MIGTRRKKIGTLSHAIAWFASAGIIFSLFFIRPHPTIFVAWNATVRRDYEEMQKAAKKMRNSSSEIYRREGHYYSALSQALTEDVEAEERNKRHELIAKDIEDALRTLPEKGWHSKGYARKMRFLLAWLYFHKARYAEAAEQYLKVLVKDEKDEMARYNYEWALLLHSLFVEEPRLQTGDEKKTAVPEILSLFKVKEAGEYFLLETQGADTRRRPY